MTCFEQLPQERFARNKAMYSLMYAEALKNLELADYALKDRLPYVQVIDAPIPPIVGYGYGKKKAVLLGLLLGLLVGSLFVIGRKFLSEQFKQ
jgi:LPS O-antigen subunit length determinant protein (WzzB/FepE family)